MKSMTEADDYSGMCDLTYFIVQHQVV